PSKNIIVTPRLRMRKIMILLEILGENPFRHNALTRKGISTGDDEVVYDDEGERKEAELSSESDSENTCSSSTTISDVGKEKNKSRRMEIKPPTPKKLSP